ncbi:MAG: prephenate dehydratase domain-containing protein, partial [Oscillospiraceae bacterium]
MDIKTLKQSRTEIDNIDAQIARLMVDRMNIMEAVAEYKQSTGLPILNTQREQEVLSHIACEAPQYEDSLRMLYSVIFELCKERQFQLMAKASDLTAEVQNSLQKEINDEDGLKIACQGVEGAYSHIAARTVFKQSAITFYKTFSDVFEAVQSGKADFGVLPIENSTAGSVNEVYDLMSHYRFYIAKSVKLKIDHCLVACEGTTPQSIKRIYSHEQGLRQCSELIKSFNAQAMPTLNTAGAAEYVSTQNDTSIAAISSLMTAKLYGLQVLQTAVQNAGYNYTRFIIISKKLIISDTADRISLSMSIPHISGSLNQILMLFAAHRLNLTKLESRPIPNTNFEFMFYFDIEGKIKDKAVLQLIEQLAQ